MARMYLLLLLVLAGAVGAITSRGATEPEGDGGDDDDAGDGLADELAAIRAAHRQGQDALLGRLDELASKVEDKGDGPSPDLEQEVADLRARVRELQEAGDDPGPEPGDDGDGEPDHQDQEPHE